MVPEEAVEGQDVGVGYKRHGVALALVEGFAVRSDLDEEAPAGLEVAADEVVEAEDVLLLGELDVVGDVLEDLGHEDESAFDVRRRLLLDDPHLEGGDNGRVDEAEEHDRAHGADVVLLALREPFAQDLETKEIVSKRGMSFS